MTKAENDEFVKRLNQIVESQKRIAADIEAGRCGYNPHTRLASELAGCAEADVTVAQRTAAKHLNFWILYGNGSRKSAQDVPVQLREWLRTMPVGGPT